MSKNSTFACFSAKKVGTRHAIKQLSVGANSRNQHK